LKAILEKKFKIGYSEELKFSEKITFFCQNCPLKSESEVHFEVVFKIRSKKPIRSNFPWFGNSQKAEIFKK